MKFFQIEKSEKMAKNKIVKDKMVACEHYLNEKCKSLECWHAELHIPSNYCGRPCSINKKLKNAKCLFPKGKKNERKT